MCMVNVLVGDNGNGKTQFLKQMLRKEGTISNIASDKSTEFVSISEEKVNELSEITGAKCSTNGSEVFVKDFKVGRRYVDIGAKLLSILTLLCREGSVLLLDEPDTHLTEDDINILTFILEYCENLFNEIWVVTHNMIMLNIESCKYYKISKGNICSISKDDAYEYINSI